MKILTDYRQWHSPNCSVGRLHLPDNSIFCYTLCDTIRAWGIKVPRFTAIPATDEIFYNVGVTFSQRFQKELPIIYTEIDKDGNYLLKAGGIEFSAVRFHGGNTDADTDACVLTAFAYDGKDKIYNPTKNRADDALTKIIKEYLKTDTVGLKVVNLANRL